MVESQQPISPADVARHYDQLDRFYREIWGEHVHHGWWRTGKETSLEAVRALSDLVAKSAQIAPGARVCDVGCGYGGTSRILAEEYGATVTGITLSPTQQAYAAAIAGAAGNPVYHVEDWLANRQADEEFDAVIAIESTEHMADKVRVFEEAMRVLRPGGRLVVCAWLAGNELRGWEERWLVEPVCREGRLPGMGTEGEYASWIESAGLILENRLEISRQVSRTWPICAARFALALLRRPGYIKFVMDPKNDNRVFAFTMLRIWLAYRTGAMRYIVFTASKPQQEAS